jgi:hypothetical protein
VAPPPPAGQGACCRAGCCGCLAAAGVAEGVVALCGGGRLGTLGSCAAAGMWLPRWGGDASSRLLWGWASVAAAVTVTVRC